MLKMIELAAKEGHNRFSSKELIKPKYTGLQILLIGLPQRFF